MNDCDLIKFEVIHQEKIINATNLDYLLNKIKDFDNKAINSLIINHPSIVNLNNIERAYNLAKKYFNYNRELSINYFLLAEKLFNAYLEKI